MSTTTLEAMRAGRVRQLERDRAKAQARVSEYYTALRVESRAFAIRETIADELGREHPLFIEADASWRRAILGLVPPRDSDFAVVA